MAAYHIHQQTVSTKVKDRSKTVRRMEDGNYEYGWAIFNRRDRSKDYFLKVGDGSYEEALDWMSKVQYETKGRRVFKSFTSDEG